MRGLGIQTSRTVNQSLSSAVNLVVGHTCFLTESSYQALRTGPYMAFQVEALSEESGFLGRYPDYLDFLAGALQILDYSEANIAFLAGLGINNVSYIPIGYSSRLERIDHQPCKDMDVLFYGAESPRRRNVLEELKSRDVAVHWLFGCYGLERDEFIGRAKIILNMHQFEMKHLEQIRISYLLNNRCFVVSEESDSRIYGEGVVFCEYEQIADTCASFLRPENEIERNRIAELGYQNLRAIPMKSKIKEALEAVSVAETVTAFLIQPADPRPPVLIMGMHRSGTTLLTNMLRDLGLFIGHKTDPNFEAILFLSINNWLLELANATWDDPGGLKDLLQIRSNVIAIRKEVRRLIDENGAAYLQSAEKVTSHTLRSMPIPWGWKDPRNTFSLPLWLSLFPNARIIHVKRHGVDVASSVQKRQCQYFEEMDQGLRRQNRALPPSVRIGGWLSTRRCTTLEGAFELWEEYVTQGARHVERLGAQAMEVTFEELLKEPARILSEICRFCDLGVNPERIESVATRVNGNRGLAYRRSFPLLQFAETVSHRLEKFGY
jgi:hypothetical protein